MGDTSKQKQLLPHYIAVLVLTVAALAVVSALPVSRWFNLVAVVLVVLTYPTLVRLLGVEPDAWQADDRAG
jgi:hypothetical protein